MLRPALLLLLGDGTIDLLLRRPVGLPRSRICGRVMRAVGARRRHTKVNRLCSRAGMGTEGYHSPHRYSTGIACAMRSRRFSFSFCTGSLVWFGLASVYGLGVSCAAFSRRCLASCVIGLDWIGLDREDMSAQDGSRECI